MNEGVLTTWARRSVSITLYAGLCVVAVVGFPVVLGLAALVDLWRGGNRAATVRCAAVATIYLLCEVAGLAACLALWIARPLLRGSSATGDRRRGSSDRYLAATFRLQCWWACALYRSAARLFGMRALVDGDEAVRDGPFVLFCRHASIGDALLPAVFVAARHGISVRHILKRELLWDPCLDVVGHRLPNYFIRRGSGDSRQEIARLQGLAEHLGARDAVAIFPEGTFFTPAEQARALARIRRTLPAAQQAVAASLRHVLPPRLSGSLGVLERGGIDAVFCAHTGLEAAGTWSAIARGALIGQTLRIRFWRVPGAEIPRDPAGRAAWLYGQWAGVDQWIAEHIADDRRAG